MSAHSGEPFDVITEARRFVLAATSEAYEVRSREATSEPLATFPLTDEGLEEAERDLRSRERSERWSSVRVHRLLSVVLFSALGAWLVFGTIDLVWSIVGQFGFAVPPEIGFGEPDRPAVRLVVQILAAVSFRVWVAALVALAAMRFLVTRGD